MRALLPAVMLYCLFAAEAGAEGPFRLEPVAKVSDWITLSGEARVRYETLDGQFRAGGEGGDQLLLLRTLIQAEADTGPVTFGVELQDSRTYLGDRGTSLSTSIVNPLDMLQLYARVDDLPGLLGDGSISALTLGRQTVSIGSRRQIERVEFANVIFIYTVALWMSENQRGDELHLLYVVPTQRFPDMRPDLDDNQLSGNEEQWGRRIWGVHYSRADILPAVMPGLSGEVFVYGLEEEDTKTVQTPDRSHIAPGFRLYRKPKTGQWDADLVAALRKGTRYASSSSADMQSLRSTPPWCSQRSATPSIRHGSRVFRSNTIMPAATSVRMTSPSIRMSVCLAAGGPI